MIQITLEKKKFHLFSRQESSFYRFQVEMVGTLDSPIDGCLHFRFNAENLKRGVLFVLGNRVELNVDFNLLHEGWGGHMRKLLWIVVVALLLSVASSYAEQFQGGYTLQYVSAAQTIPKGSRTYLLHTRGSMVSIDGDSWSNATIAFSYNYGFLQNTELEVSGVLYQDLNLSSVPGDDEQPRTANTPGRIYLRWKYAGKQFGTSPFFWGLQGTLLTKFSSETVENVYLEPYSSSNLGMQFNVLFSYLANPLSIEDGLQITYNFGYVNYNDSGQFSTSTDAMVVYSGISYPLNQRLTLALESQGTYVMSYPQDWAEVYSIEAYGYLTPSIRYAIMPGVSLLSGIDIKYYENDELTDKTLQPSSAPSYPGWRVTSKLIFTSEAVGGPAYQQASMPGMQQQSYGQQSMMMPGQMQSANRAALYDWGGSVRDDIQYIEVELEKIREDRIEAENKLRQIREKLQQGK